MNPQSRSVQLSADADILYRHLLRSGAAPLSVYAAELGWSDHEAFRVFEDLAQMRLARIGPDGTVRSEDPRATIGRLLDAEEAELDLRRSAVLSLRESLETYELDYRRGLQLAGPVLPPWDRVQPGEAAQVVQHLARTSEGDILQVTARVGAGPAHDTSVRRSWQSTVGSGRAIRSLLPVTALADPRLEAFLMERAAAGEEQRFLPDEEIPVEFAVFGRSGAVLDEGGASGEDFLLVRAEALIDTFVALFVALWKRAEPVGAQDASDQEVRLLQLLDLGMKDEAIARQLGLGLRTVRRRIAVLMEEHGADTRFQLGAAAHRRGLLG